MYLMGCWPLYWSGLSRIFTEICEVLSIAVEIKITVKVNLSVY